jgi:type III secretory pathway component EscT
MVEYYSILFNRVIIMLGLLVGLVLGFIIGTVFTMYRVGQLISETNGVDLGTGFDIAGGNQPIIPFGEVEYSD